MHRTNLICKSEHHTPHISSPSSQLMQPPPAAEPLSKLYSGVVMNYLVHSCCLLRSKALASQYMYTLVCKSGHPLYLGVPKSSQICKWEHYVLCCCTLKGFSSFSSLTRWMVRVPRHFKSCVILHSALKYPPNVLFSLPQRF